MTNLETSFDEAEMNSNLELVDQETREMQQLIPSDSNSNLIQALIKGIRGDNSSLQDMRSCQYPTNIMSDVESFDEFFESNGQKLLVRHYYPKNSHSREELPLFIYIHGGGWCFSYSDQRNCFASTISKLCNVEFVLLNYSLSPEAAWGVALNEVYSIYKYLLSKSQPNRQIFLCGDSAGGNLSACLIHKIKQSEEVRIPTALLLFYPVIDCVNSYESHKTFGSGFGLDLDVMKKYIEAYCPDAEMRKSPLVSPIFGSLDNFPPSLVITSQFDILRNEGFKFAQKLDEAGVKVRYKCIESAQHGFLAIPQLSKLFDESVSLISDFLALFKDNEKNQ